MKKFAHCFECKRLLPLELLEQVEYYEGHITAGDMHHKLLCRACIKKAEEVLSSIKNYKGIRENK